MHISAHQKLSSDLELTGIHILRTSGCYLTAPRTRLTAGWLSGRVRFHASITMECTRVEDSTAPESVMGFNTSTTKEVLLVVVTVVVVIVVVVEQ